jgi:hypothetical protein
MAWKVLFIPQLWTEKLEMLPVLRKDVQEPLYQDTSNNMWQLQGTILVDINLFDIYVLYYISLPSNILSISLYIIAWKLKNLNKSTILTLLESVNQIIKKVAIIILKIWVQNAPSSIKVGSYFAL